MGINLLTRPLFASLPAAPIRLGASQGTLIHVTCPTKACVRAVLAPLPL